MSEDILDGQVAAIRRFSRFYTARLGVLRERLNEGPFTLPEGRIVFELATVGPTTASALVASLGLDAGYVSRLLKSLEAGGFIARRQSPTDGRQTEISLTSKGRAGFAVIDSHSAAEVRSLLQDIPPADRARLVENLREACALLNGGRDAGPGYILRDPKPGDMGWVVSRHGALYAREFGWNAEFEALVAKIVADYIENHDPARERCWIAERDGAPVGSVFLVKHGDDVAKLRLLLVDPSARGLGIGQRLIREVIEEARFRRYKRLTLWTNTVLTGARRLYEAAGFTLDGEEPHRSFGCDLVAQTWSLDLSDRKS